LDVCYALQRNYAYTGIRHHGTIRTVTPTMPFGGMIAWYLGTRYMCYCSNSYGKYGEYTAPEHDYGTCINGQESCGGSDERYNLVFIAG